MTLKAIGTKPLLWLPVGLGMSAMLIIALSCGIPRDPVPGRSPDPHHTVER